MGDGTGVFSSGHVLEQIKGFSFETVVTPDGGGSLRSSSEIRKVKAPRQRMASASRLASYRTGLLARVRRTPNVQPSLPPRTPASNLRNRIGGTEPTRVQDSTLKRTKAIRALPSTAICLTADFV